uniref:PPIase cyclophilin-type domain-containing protein n=1 Tax=Leersia perrieri TaxID=77586 RepID=A0A0D9UVX8_9ORYZ
MSSAHPILTPGTNPTLPSSPPQPHNHNPPPPKLGRRAAAALAIAAAPAAILSVVKPLPSIAAAQEQAPATAPCIADLPVTSTAFLDISIGGEPAGRITIGLFGDAAPTAASRFLSLVTGVGYRRKEFIKIVPGYVQHGGVVSYPPVTPALADRLAAEADAVAASCGGTGRIASAAGAVAIVVRDPSLPPPKPKLVARGGKLEVDQEQVGVVPNATGFVITTGGAGAGDASPELDASALVIGRVVDGMDVVDKIAAVPTVRDNTASPYFRVAKLIGDKRAVVAERGFNRPYTKILVTNCGVLEQKQQQ